MAASGGCKGSKGMVPVSGKLTYQGGAWSCPGQVIFSPLGGGAGGSHQPAMAVIAADGSFKAKTLTADGIAPGEYGIALRCLAKPGTTHDEAQSALPARYGTASTSGLKLSVPEGSAPIYVEWNVDGK